MAIQAQMYPDNLALPFAGSQDWLMDINHNNINNNNNNLFVFNGGCGLNDLGFNLQHKQQQPQPQQQQLQLQQLQQQVQSSFQHQQQQQQQYLVQFHNLQQRNHNLPSGNAFVFLASSKNNNNNGCTSSTVSTTGSSDPIPMNISQTLAAQLDKQRLEINTLISLQNERLKFALLEQRKRQLTTILRKADAKARMLLKEKDDEIAKAKNRGMELEECVRRMEMESQAWQRLAADKEAMVSSLNNTLEQLRQEGCYSNCAADDAHSCCDDNHYSPGNDETRGERIKSNRTMMKMKMACRFCNSRESCMLLLPCRHLCSCKSCEPFIQACPLCKSPKSGSIEALFS